MRAEQGGGHLKAGRGLLHKQAEPATPPLGLTASKTVKKLIPIFKPPHLRYFLTAAQANTPIEIR